MTSSARRSANEARRKFQRYFFTALLIAATLHFAVIFGGIGVQAFMNRKKAEEATRQVKLVPYRDISAPPSLDAKPPEPPKFAFKAPEFKAPPSGIPVPVPKEEAVKTTIASQEQNPFASAQGDTGLGSDLSAGVPWGVEGGGDLVIEEDVLPNPDDFVAVEQQPVLVEKPPPVYPELAQMAKIEGTVIVRVLVGKDGKVKDAILGKGVNDILDQVGARRRQELRVPAGHAEQEAGGGVGGDPVQVLALLGLESTIRASRAQGRGR